LSTYFRDRTLVATGGRVTEICSIRRQNVNLDEQVVKILGKGRKERIVPIPPIIVNQIREYIEAETRRVISYFRQTISRAIRASGR